MKDTTVALLRELSGHMEAYGFPRSQWGGIRQRIRAHLDELNKTPIAALSQEAGPMEEMNRLITLGQQITHEKNAAYRERNHCVALIARLCYGLYECGASGFDAWRGHHVDKPGEEPWDPKWRNVIFIRIPTGQLSWHIEEGELTQFAWLPLRNGIEGAWDGHTTEQKYSRILTFVINSWSNWKISADNHFPRCGTCGANQVYIRGKEPGFQRRLVCPTCAVERLERIESIASEHERPPQERPDADERRSMVANRVTSGAP